MGERQDREAKPYTIVIVNKQPSLTAQYISKKKTTGNHELSSFLNNYLDGNRKKQQKKDEEDKNDEFNQSRNIFAQKISNIHPLRLKGVNGKGIGDTGAHKMESRPRGQKSIIFIGSNKARDPNHGKAQVVQNRLFK